MMKTIALASDHAGYGYKEALKPLLEARGLRWVDYGAPSAESVDYPDMAHAASCGIQSGECDGGIFVCGTGIGIGIAANRHKGIRAAMCQVMDAVVMSRKHNDSNVLALGSRLLSFEEAWRMVEVWLDTPFEGGRHQRRVEKIELR
jgi:ribose 5-phosphate isomerase B